MQFDVPGLRSVFPTQKSDPSSSQIAFEDLVEVSFCHKIEGITAVILFLYDFVDGNNILLILF
jgi:hypothetical protein